MYYKLEDNFIIKYIVNIDKIKLEEIKKIIIDKCSIISHIKYESENAFYLTNNKDSEIIKNYQEQVREVNENNKISKIYTISYDYYSFDMLVNIINALLNDQYEFIDYLYNANFKENEKKQQLIALKNDLITKSDITKLDEYNKEIALIEKMDNNHKLALSFIPDIFATITLEEVKRYSLEELNAFTEFLNIQNINVRKLNKNKKILL